jgi:hypothetical protein
MHLRLDSPLQPWFDNTMGPVKSSWSNPGLGLCDIDNGVKNVEA